MYGEARIQYWNNSARRWAFSYRWTRALHKTTAPNYHKVLKDANEFGEEHAYRLVVRVKSGSRPHQEHKDN